MTTYWLKFCLESDTTFGRGDGVAGVVDTEVQHDEYGLPYLGGKTLKGLLGAECAEILFALTRMARSDIASWEAAALFLFGEPGSGMAEAARMRVGDARLPNDLRMRLAAEFRPFESLPRAETERKRGLLRVANLESLTALRRQTAMDATTGAPKKNTLRTMRVILRATLFEALLEFVEPPGDYARWLLVACVKAFRRAGTGRNRGRGRLQAELYDQYPVDHATGLPVAPVTEAWFGEFRKVVSI